MTTSTRAKKITATPAAGTTNEMIIFTATATGRGGRACTRKTNTTECRWAVDVADSDAKAVHLRTGAVWTFHATKEQAEKQVEKFNEKANLSAVVIEATPAPIS